jgi:CheY-like chemotaxis protein
MKREKKALVVDDDGKAQSTISGVLWRSGWAAPTLVAEGEEALKLLKEQPDAFDLIILDQTLSDMKGLEVLARAKRATHKLPPVVMLTGDNDSTLETKAKELGVMAFIMKHEFDRLEELLVKLAKAVQR